MAVSSDPDSEDRSHHSSTHSDKDDIPVRPEEDDLDLHDHDDDNDNDDNLERTPTQLLDPEAPGFAGTLGRALSKISTNAGPNPGPAPDGGRKAWLACLCGHLIVSNTWGFINSFGIFQRYYVDMLGRSPSDVSWIGSLEVFLLFFLGMFTGRLSDADLFKPLIVLGTFLMVLGFMMTSIATQYWHLVLSQGVCMGLGAGCLFAPCLATVATYFSSKRMLAIGIVACGSVTGGLVYPAMARQLLPMIGFAWTMRAIGLISLATLLPANFLMSSRLPPRRTGALVDWESFKDLGYTFYAVGMFFNFWGLYFTFYYLVSYSTTWVTPAFSYIDALNLLLVLNGIGLVGRLLPNYLADRVGPLNLLAPACLMSGVLMFVWIVIDTPWKLYVWTTFYGISGGAIQSLFPAALSSLTTDPRKQGTRMGMVFTIVSFAVLTGNPIAGAIITGTPGGSYVGAQCFAGCDLLVGAGFITASRMVKMRKSGAGWLFKA
ncbi:major facilitator superfamily domain-containing protein [Microdochium trichocladiopsis]|uniref:Major facilitator superfamily domain-containing protein n=1 Tax=Microdochium trichocladiopsis TaxID=1682393 RepID=A0A9P9BJP4_9PEZI|nr:major facilitator superfamily domain-containing protein [Microdochium trichocladiopsis]KAH7018300.1 major facilitator superfamily domain-containing protein [Microdochium trichocladiopsis]